MGLQQAPMMIRALRQELLPQPMAQAAKAPQVKGQTDHLVRACRSTRVEPFIPLCANQQAHVQLDPP